MVVLRCYFLALHTEIIPANAQGTKHIVCLGLNLVDCKQGRCPTHCTISLSPCYFYFFSKNLENKNETFLHCQFYQVPQFLVLA